MARKSHSSSPSPVPRVRIVQPSGRPFQIRYFCPIEKREIRMSVGSRDMAEAERLKSEVEARLLLGISVESQTEKLFGPEMDWESFREEYRTLQLATLRENSASDAESRLDLAERIMKPKTLGDLGHPATLQRLQTRLRDGECSRRKKPRARATVHGYMGSIVAALNWAYLQGWLTEQPRVSRLKVLKGKVMKGRPIAEPEFRRMLKATAEVVGEEAAESWRFVLRGLWNSALRIDELMHLSWDLPGTIRPVWREGELPVLDIPALQQKNDTDQSIPLLPWFEAVLHEVVPGERTGWVFEPASLQLKLGRRIQHERPNSEWVSRIVCRIGKAAGVLVVDANEETGQSEKYASAHDLRRSCGERLRNAQVPPLLICRVMRHSSWETTSRHYAPGNIQLEAAALREILADRDSSQ
jgi:integrase